MFPDTKRDIVTELYVNGDWVDISSDVQYDNGNGCTVERGRRDESPRCSAQKLRCVLNDTSGNYSPKNPLGAYYPSFGLNTPIRQSFREIRDRFGRTVVDSPGTADTGQVYTTASSGGTIAAADYQVTGSALTMRMPTSGLYRRVKIGEADLYLSTVEARADFQLPFSDVTGGTISLGIHLRVSAASTGYKVYAVINTDETISIKIESPTATLTTTTVSGLTHTGQTLTLVASVEGETARGKVFAASGVEPYGWHAEVHDSGALVPPGGVILETAAAAGNTNTRPYLTTVDNLEVRSPRIAAEISSPPRGRDETGNWQYVGMTASGILQRLSQGQDPLQSTLRRAYLADDVDAPVAYWPCEDGENATQIASGIPGHRPMEVNGSPNFASNNDFDCSDSLPAINQSGWLGVVPAYETSAGQAQVRFLLSVPAAGDGGGTTKRLFTVRTNGSARHWDLVYTNSGGGLLTLNVYDAGIALLHTTGTVDFSLHGNPCRVSLELDQDGADIDWALSTLRLNGAGGGISGTLAGRDFDTIDAVAVDYEDRAFTSTAVGHITVEPVITGIGEQLADLLAHVAETAGRRAKRLCEQQSIPFTWRGDLDDTVQMGPQRVKTLLDLLHECADAELGTIHESRGSFGLVFRTRASAYNQDPTVTVDHEARQLAYPFLPNPDDQLPRNKVTVKRDGGSEATAISESGRMSILSPQDGGIGSYGTSATVNVYADTQLPDMAGWLLALGTVLDERHPEIKLDLARSAVADDPVLRWAVLDLDVDDLLEITNTAELRTYDDIRQLARGYTETYTQVTHTLAANGTPASPYDVWELETADYDRLDTAGCELAVAINSSAPALSVATTAGPLWITTASHPTHLPFDVMIGGERITVTDSDNVPITYGAVGSSAVADRGVTNNVSPGLPAGHAAGNLLVVLAGIRRNDEDATAPTNYATLLDTDDGVQLFGKIDGGSEGAPTVSWVGGGSGDTIAAQMISLGGKFYDVENLVVASAAALNTSQQNIPYPGLTVPCDDCIVIYGGVKWDDCTSVTSPGTEIAEVSTTTGNDLTMVWAYQIQTTRSNIAPGSFTVTGGAAAVSVGFVVALRCDRQDWTVTRSVNDVVKSHAVGAEIALPPLALAL